MTDTITDVRGRLAIALDTPDLATATTLAAAVQPHIGIAKIGLQLWSAAGRDAIAAARDLGLEVFLDVKLHDIPNTVAGAAEVLGAVGARYVTVHAAGGLAMIRAAVDGLAGGASAAGHPTPMVLAVTVLTSQTDAPADLLTQRVAVAIEGGAGGVVCAVSDLPAVTAAGPGLLAVTPGIRPAGVGSHDQVRVAAPAAAIEGGAGLLVLGRAVTAAEDPAAAAQSIAEEVTAAL